MGTATKRRLDLNRKADLLLPQAVGQGSGSLPPIRQQARAAHSSAFSRKHVGRFYQDGSFAAFDRQKAREDQEREKEHVKHRAESVKHQRERVERELEKELALIRKMESKLHQHYTSQPQHSAASSQFQGFAPSESSNDAGSENRSSSQHSPSPPPPRRRVKSGQLAFDGGSYPEQADFAGDEKTEKARRRREARRQRRKREKEERDLRGGHEHVGGGGVGSRTISLTEQVLLDGGFLAGSGWAAEEGGDQAGEASGLGAGEWFGNEACTGEDVEDAMGADMDLCAYMEQRRFGAPDSPMVQGMADRRTEDDCAIVIQSMVRQHIAHRRAAIRRRRHGERTRRDKAATAIQRNIRGHFVRRSCKSAAEQVATHCPDHWQADLPPAQRTDGVGCSGKDETQPVPIIYSMDPNQVKQWLEVNNLAACGQVLAARHIDGAMLADEDLSDADLVELGITLSIHRRRILKLVHAAAGRVPANQPPLASPEPKMPFVATSEHKDEQGAEEVQKEQADEEGVSERQFEEESDEELDSLQEEFPDDFEGDGGSIGSFLA